MVSDFTWYLLSFKGRISRQEFWLGYAGIIVIMLLLRRPLENFMLAIFRPQADPGSAMSSTGRLHWPTSWPS